jgi:ribosome-binding factor A
MGDEKKQQLALRGLQNSAGFLQSKIGERIDTRYIPKLTFELDKGVKQSIEISRMLSELLPKKDEPEEAPADEERDE